MWFCLDLVCLGKLRRKKINTVVVNCKKFKTESF